MRKTGWQPWLIVALAGASACASSGGANVVYPTIADQVSDTMAARLLALQSRVDSLQSMALNLRQDLEATRADVRALTLDLQTMRSESGAKITAMEAGMQFDLPILFAFNSAVIRPEDYPSIVRLVHVLQRYHPKAHVTVMGYADRAGPSAYNVRLSERRAKAVIDYMASQGADPSLLAAEGRGSIREVTPGATKDAPGAEDNRRVVFVIESRGLVDVRH